MDVQQDIFALPWLQRNSRAGQSYFLLLSVLNPFPSIEFLIIFNFSIKLLLTL
jgi:hypothetical protein